MCVCIIIIISHVRLHYCYYLLTLSEMTTNIHLVYLLTFFCLRVTSATARRRQVDTSASHVRLVASHLVRTALIAGVGTREAGLAKHVQWEAEKEKERK